MVDLEEKKVKVEGEVVRVYVRFARRMGDQGRRRFYTHDALELIKETHPKLVVGDAVKVCTAKNYGDSLEGEWVFKLVKKDVLKKRNTKPAVKNLSKVVDEEISE